MAKPSIRSPSGRTSTRTRKPKSDNDGKGKKSTSEEKQKEAVTASIKLDFMSKRESLLRLKKLDQTLDRQNMGLNKGGDMKYPLKDIAKGLKESKAKRGK